MYDYLVLVLLLGVLWVVLFYQRKDLRKVMLWTGTFYLIATILGFIVYKLMSTDPSREINPGYWSPPSLFNLNNRLGISLEDLLFAFFLGGVASSLYEFVLKKKEATKKIIKRSLPYGLAAGVLAAYLITHYTFVNDIYALIFFNIFSGLVMLWQRKDLAKKAVISGIFLLVLYIAAEYIFTKISPQYIHTYAHLHHTSKIIILGIPLEEYLFAFTFGLAWGPMYEYIRGLGFPKPTKANL